MKKSDISKLRKRHIKQMAAFVKGEDGCPFYLKKGEKLVPNSGSLELRSPGYAPHDCFMCWRLFPGCSSNCPHRCYDGQYFIRRIKYFLGGLQEARGL